jgi:hypothetical protein
MIVSSENFPRIRLEERETTGLEINVLDVKRAPVKDFSGKEAREILKKIELLCAEVTGVTQFSDMT